MSTVQIPTSAPGYRQSIVQQAQQAQRQVNRMQMSPQLNPRGFVQPLGRITNSASEFQKSMDASAARVFAFGAAVGVINGISDAFKALISSAAEVEKALKDVQVVMETTNTEIKKFGDGLFDVARNTATSFQLVANSAIELARQGLTAEETLARVNSALILSRLSGLDTVKSTEALTAAINSFNKEGINHEQIVNRMANVDASFAVSSADLAEAISRAGAVAQSSGVSFNELAAVVTAVQQRTARGGAVIGNGFKSIFTRIKRSGVREALEDIGVATKNNDGSFRSSIDILRDYAKVYETLSDAQKSFTSEQIAGVFQIQNLQALVQDLNSGFSVFSRALGVANNTTDEATRRNEALNTTLSALFTQTSVSAKELAATIGELAFSDNFKEILTFLNNLAKSINDFLSEDKGSEFARNLVKGIGGFLTGPGLVIIGAAFIKIFALVGKFAKDAFADLLGLNKESKRQQGLQAAIGQALSANAGLYQQILAASGNSVKQEQIILNLIRQETAERVKQEALIKRIASSSALIGIGAGDAGFVAAGTRGQRRAGKQKLGLASGFLPAMNKEMSDINQGVGGARRGDKPVPMRINTSAGKSQQVVANTGEFVVRDFAGSGGDAIFNREMIKKFGLPKGAKKINVSSGFVPSFAKTQEVFATAGQLGWKEVTGRGRKNEIGRRSDIIDSFKGKIKFDRLKQTSGEIGTLASQTLSGKGGPKSRELPFFIKKGKNYVLNPQYKNADDAIKKKLTNQFGSKALQSGTGKNLVTQIRDLSKGFNAQNSSGKFRTLSTLLKGLHGEKLAVAHLKSKGVSAKAIEKSGFFDIKTPRRKFEVKSGKTVNNFQILKKAASEFLIKSGGNEKDGYPFKDDISQMINVSNQAGLGKFINLILPKGTIASNQFDKQGNPVIQMPRAASGFIPNFARRMHDGFGMQMGGSGVRSKKFKDSGSYLEYKGNELEYIQSMRKGDANLLFDRFVRQKGSVYSPGIKQNRSFKQGSKTNFEDLIYAFPQLQYRLKKGFSTTGRFVGANGESFRFLSLKDLKDKINKGYGREEFRSYLGGSGVVGMGKMDIQDLTTSRIKGSGDNIYKNYAKGLIPNFASGVKTSLGFVSTQRINRLKEGEAINLGDNKGIKLDKFSDKDKSSILGFAAVNSKEALAAAQVARKQAKNEMPTIDASRQATMLVATENFRKKVDTTFKKSDGTNFRIRYRTEGLKPSKLKGTEQKLRTTMEDLMISESTKLAKNLSGAGKFSANNRVIKNLANAGSAGSAAGTVFETAMQSIGKNKLFTKNNAGFDIAGFPDKGLQNLFGYYTPFADAKIGLTPDTKRDFNKKVINLPSSSRGMSSKDRRAQGKMALNTRRKFGAPTNAAGGFIPALTRAFETEKKFGGDPILDYNSKIGAYVRDRKTQKNFADVKRDHPEGMKKAIQNSKKMQGLSDGYIPNFISNPFTGGGAFAPDIKLESYQSNIDAAAVELAEQEALLAKYNDNLNEKALVADQAIAEEKALKTESKKAKQKVQDLTAERDKLKNAVKNGNASQKQLDKVNDKLKQARVESQRVERDLTKSTKARVTANRQRGAAQGQVTKFENTGSVSDAQDKLKRREREMGTARTRADQQTRRKAALNNAALSAAFVLPMIAAQVRGNRSDEEMGAARGGVEDALNFGSFGALFGGKGIAVGGAIGVASAIAKAPEREITKNLFKGLKKEKADLDKIMSDTRAIDLFGQSLAKLKTATENNDVEQIIEANEQIVDSLSQIDSTEILDEMMKIQDSSLSAAQKLNLVADALQRLSDEKQTQEAVVNLATSLTDPKKRRKGSDNIGDRTAMQTVRQVLAFFSGGQQNSPFRFSDAEERALADPFFDGKTQDKTAAREQATPFIKLMTQATQVDQGDIIDRITNQILEGGGTTGVLENISTGLGGDRQSETISRALQPVIEKIGEDLEGGLSLNQGEVSGRLRELSGSKTFGANFDLAERSASLEAFQKELNNVMKATRSFRAGVDPIFGLDQESIGVGTLRNTETGRLLRDEDPSQLRELEKSIAAFNVILGRNQDGSFQLGADSTLRDVIFEDALKQIERHGKVIGLTADQIEKMAEEVEKHVTIQKDSYDRFVDLNKTIERSKITIADFNTSIRSARSGLQNFSEFLSSGIDFRAQFGSINQEQASLQQLNLGLQTTEQQAAINEQEALFNLISKSINIMDAFNQGPPPEVTGSGRSRGADPDAQLKKFSKQFSEEQTESDREIAKLFEGFMKQNADGDISTNEMQVLLQKISEHGIKGNSLQQQALAISRGIAADTKSSKESLILRNRIEQAQISLQRLQSRGAQRFGESELKTIGDLVIPEDEGGIPFTTRVTPTGERKSRVGPENPIDSQGNISVTGDDLIEFGNSLQDALSLAGTLGIDQKSLTGLTSAEVAYIIAQANAEQAAQIMREVGGERFIPIIGDLKDQNKEDFQKALDLDQTIAKLAEQTGVYARDTHTAVIQSNIYLSDISANVLTQATAMENVSNATISTNQRLIELVALVGSILGQMQTGQQKEDPDPVPSYGPGYQPGSGNPKNDPIMNPFLVKPPPVPPSGQPGDKPSDKPGGPVVVMTDGEVFKNIEAYAKESLETLNGVLTGVENNNSELALNNERQAEKLAIAQENMERMNQLTETIVNLPTLIKEELSQVVINHEVSGGLNMNFNTEAIERSLGPVMYEQLLTLLQDGMILDYLAAALGKRIDKEGLLKEPGE